MYVGCGDGWVRRQGWVSQVFALLPCLRVPHGMPFPATLSTISRLTIDVQHALIRHCCLPSSLWLCEARSAAPAAAKLQAPNSSCCG